jgi:hypothetical protein
MAAVRVQQVALGVDATAASTVISTGTTPALTTTTAGNTLVAKCHLRTGATQSVSSVTDSASNTWTLQVSAFLSGQNTKVEIWTCVAAASVTSITMTTSASVWQSLHIEEWSGVTTPVTSAGAGAAASTTPAAVTVSVVSGQPVSGGITYPNATAPSSLAAPFTAETGVAESTGPQYHANAYHIATSTTSEGPAWTLASSVASGAATVSLTVAATTQ